MCGWSIRRSIACGSRGRTLAGRWSSSPSGSRRPRRRPRRRWSRQRRVGSPTSRCWSPTCVSRRRWRRSSPRRTSGSKDSSRLATSARSWEWPSTIRSPRATGCRSSSPASSRLTCSKASFAVSTSWRRDVTKWSTSTVDRSAPRATLPHRRSCERSSRWSRANGVAWERFQRADWPSRAGTAPLTPTSDFQARGDPSRSPRSASVA